jgi:hypothetical protein
VGAQQIDPKLVGAWETNDGTRCSPCILTVEANGTVKFTLAGSAVDVLFAQGTDEPGLRLIMQAGGKLDLGLSKSGWLVGFYTDPNNTYRNVSVAFRRK